MMFLVDIPPYIQPYSKKSSERMNEFVRDSIEASRNFRQKLLFPLNARRTWNSSHEGIIAMESIFVRFLPSTRRNNFSHANTFSILRSIFRSRFCLFILSSAFINVELNSLDIQNVHVAAHIFMLTHRMIIDWVTESHKGRVCIVRIMIRYDNIDKEYWMFG